MTDLTRRGFLRGLLALVLAGLFVPIYAFLVEPTFRFRVKKWLVRRPEFKTAMKIAILTDLHMAEPTTPRARVRRIVARANALGADVIVVLGDLTGSHPYITERIPVEDTAELLSELSAPLGVYAVLGNHDWWDDKEAQARKAGPVRAGIALQAAGIDVLENETRMLANGVCLAGLGDQWAFRDANGRITGIDDLPATLATIPEKTPTVLLAHEPDIFPDVPSRVGLTLAGHTHGGQVRILGWTPFVPSRYGSRYAYGHLQEEGRDIVVSGGIGCSTLPLRLGAVPEITLVDVGPA